MAIVGINQHFGVLFPLFSGQLLSQWEAKWEIWSALHLLLPWALGTWEQAQAPTSSKDGIVQSIAGQGTKVIPPDDMSQVERLDSPSDQGSNDS